MRIEPYLLDDRVIFVDRRNEGRVMMIHATEEELELYKKIDEAQNEEERKKAVEELRAYLIKRNEKFKNYPFENIK